MPMMLGSDQITNAARLVQLGVAESFGSRKGCDEITSEALLKKLRALTSKDGNTYRQAAEKLQRASERLQGRKRTADWLKMELDTGTDVPRKR
jgi:UDP:flavonoid glycosyltransferase YjiC (YdhE family)